MQRRAPGDQHPAVGRLGHLLASSQHLLSGFHWYLRKLQEVSEEDSLEFTSQSTWSGPGGRDIGSHGWPQEKVSPPAQRRKGLRVSGEVLGIGCVSPSCLSSQPSLKQPWGRESAQQTPLSHGRITHLGTSWGSLARLSQCDTFFLCHGFPPRGLDRARLSWAAPGPWPTPRQNHRE